MLREFKYNQFGASLWKVVWCTERCRENKFPWIFSSLGCPQKSGKTCQILIIVTEKKRKVYSVHYKNGCLPASELCHIFMQATKSYTFCY